MKEYKLVKNSKTFISEHTRECNYFGKAAPCTGTYCCPFGNCSHSLFPQYDSWREHAEASVLPAAEQHHVYVQRTLFAYSGREQAAGLPLKSTTKKAPPTFHEHLKPTHLTITSPKASSCSWAALPAHARLKVREGQSWKWTFLVFWLSSLPTRPVHHTSVQTHRCKGEGSLVTTASGQSWQQLLQLAEAPVLSFPVARALVNEEITILSSSNRRGGGSGKENSHTHPHCQELKPARKI